MRVQKGKTFRKRRFISTAIIVLVVVIALVSLIFEFYKDKLVQRQIDQILPKVSQRLGVIIEYKKISTNVLSDSKISQLAIRIPDEPTMEPLLVVDTVKIGHKIKINPHLHVKLDTVTLKGIQANLETKPDGSTNIPETLLAIVQGIAKGQDGSKELENTLEDRAKGMLKLPTVLKVIVDGGTISLKEGLFVRGEKPVLLELNRCRGEMVCDLRDKQVIVDGSAKTPKVNGKAGRLSLHAELLSKKLDITLNGKNAGISDLRFYSPEWLRFGKESTFNGVVEAQIEKNKPIKITLDADFAGLGVDHWRIASKEIRDIKFQANGLVELSKANKSVLIPFMRVGNNGAYLVLAGQVNLGDEPSIDLTVNGEDVPIQNAIDSMPEEFIPVLQGAKVNGSLGMNLHFAMDLNNPRSLVFEPNIEVSDFEVVKPPPLANVEKLKGPFVHEVKRNGEVVKTIRLSPDERDFISFENLGHFTVRGVLTCEDGRFFRHNGFQLKHIRESMIKDIKEKRFARGASTITMQTVKNLFLSGEKTFSRKFQEMLLAYYLEQTLSKKRILEIYFNIIEWGPNLYGIGPAARHYFYKSPAALKPIEAAFLGSIIANPKRYHYMYSRGEVTDTWSTYLMVIVSKMGIGPEEYEKAAPYKPEFGWVRKKRLAEEKKAKEASKDLQKEKELKSVINGKEEPTPAPKNIEEPVMPSED